MKKDKQTKKQNKKEEVKKVTKTMGGQIPSLSKEEKRLEMVKLGHEDIYMKYEEAKEYFKGMVFDFGKEKGVWNIRVTFKGFTTEYNKRYNK